ncbi:unnamed protein product, partial [marine sediment metagenome]
MDILGHGRLPIVMPAYPHMLSEDTAVWTEFLESGDFALQEVWYDLHVGAVVKGDWEDDSVPARVAAGLTRKRIDVVALVDGRYWVVEVKPYASMYAVGQIVVYEGLFIKDYEPVLETWPVIVCHSVD